MRDEAKFGFGMDGPEVLEGVLWGIRPCDPQREGFWQQDVRARSEQRQGVGVIVAFNVTHDGPPRFLEVSGHAELSADAMVVHEEHVESVASVYWRQFGVRSGLAVTE